MQLVWLAVAGAAGTLLRYAVSRAAQPLGGTTFPAGTLLVNVSGAFVLGFLATFLLGRTAVSAEARTAITIGLLGAYTTFSTFSMETLELMNGGHWAYATVNVLLSVTAALFAMWAGQSLARM